MTNERPFNGNMVFTTDSGQGMIGMAINQSDSDDPMLINFYYKNQFIGWMPVKVLWDFLRRAVIEQAAVSCNPDNIEIGHEALAALTTKVSNRLSQKR